MEPFGFVLISILGGVAFFIGLWLLITGVLRRVAGMSKSLSADTGRLLRESPWGSGSVNGVRARNCLRVAEYESGWIVRIAGIFGGGKLWLPKSGTRIGQSQAGGLFSPKYSTIVCGEDRVRLFGSLAEFVQESHSV
jgi:hypothetical protein